MNAAYFNIMDFQRDNLIDLAGDTIPDILAILRDAGIACNKNDISTARVHNNIKPAARRSVWKGEPKLVCKMMKRWKL